MFYAKVFKEFLFIFLYLMCTVFRIHPFFVFLYLILFDAVLENMVRKGPIDVDV